MNFSAKQLRQAWLNACLDEQRQVVRSVGDEAQITRYFRGIGWGWALDEHCPNGVYDDTIRRRLGLAGPLNWCGIGPAWVGVHRLGEFLVDGQCVDVGLHRGIARSVMPSTARIYYAERWGTLGIQPPERVEPDEIEPGDIICVKTGARKSYGDHFAMARLDPENGRVETVEFNAAGGLGDGAQGRGVVLRDRDLEDVAVVYRFGLRCFEGL